MTDTEHMPPEAEHLETQFRPRTTDLGPAHGWFDEERVEELKHERRMVTGDAAAEIGGQPRNDDIGSPALVVREKPAQVGGVTVWAITAAATRISEDYPERKRLLIKNTGANPVYVGFNVNQAGSDLGYELASTDPALDLTDVVGAVYASSPAGSTLRIIETSFGAWS